jgi:RND family efflux transporter MFP subunit
MRYALFSTVVTMLSLLASSGCGKDEKAAAGGQGTAGAQQAAAQRPGGATGRRQPTVVVRPVSTRDVVYTIESVGTLEAEEEVRIPARVSGPVTKVSFQEGDPVTPQTVLAEIDPARYALEYARAKAGAELATAVLHDAQQAYDQRASLRKQDPGWVSDEELRRYETALERAKADLARATTDLNLAQKNLDDSKVRPPFAGIINAKLVSTGEYVRPEGVIGTIANVRTLKLRFTVPEVDAGHIEVGQPVRFSVRAHPDREFTASIFFVSTTADPATRKVEIKARCDNPDGLLKPGFFTAVQLQAGLHHAAVMVPEEAVIPTEVGFVTYVVDQGVARQRKVEIGLRDRGEVEILKGLQPGEALVVRGGHVIADGIPVQTTDKL